MAIDFNNLPPAPHDKEKGSQQIQVPEFSGGGNGERPGQQIVIINQTTPGSKFRSNTTKFAFGALLVLGFWEAWYQVAKSPNAQNRVETQFGKDRYIPPLGVSPSSIIFGSEQQQVPGEVPVPGQAMLEKLSSQDGFSFVPVDDNASTVELPTSTTHPYFIKFQQCAIQEAKFGIPPSIKLMQGFLEGRHGESRLAKNGNNHFGMKYGTVNTIFEAANIMNLYVQTIKNPQQKQVGMEILQHVEYVRANLNGSSLHNDDAKGERFANFKTPEAGFAAHTCLILFGTMHVSSNHKDVVNYQGRYLPALLTNDYTGFAGVLKASGYATIQWYHQGLIDGINKSGLSALDRSYNPARNRLIHDVMMGYYKFLEAHRTRQGRI